MIYFASDFHLGVPDPESSLQREKLVCSWLDMVSKDASEIFLVGDVFDFWFEYKDVIPKGFARLQGKIAGLTDAGIKVYFFKGNHDMWTFGYLEKELGVKVISDELRIERNGKKFFIHHGDGLGPGDRGYKIIRSIFRNPLCIWLFAWLHPWIGVGIARFMSRRSRISKSGEDKTFLGEDKEFIVQYCREILQKEHFDFFICGHRHLPLDLKLNEQSRYINLGEWVNDFTYAVFNGTELELKKHTV